MGCGNDIKESHGDVKWINIDRYKAKGVKYVIDLEKFPYPFKKNCFDYIYARGIMEHLKDFLKVLKELHRILKPEGIVYIYVPHFSGSGAFLPLHKTFFCINALEHFVIGTTYSPSLDEKNKLFYLVERKILLYKGFWVLNYLVEPIINLFPSFQTHYERSFLKALFPATAIEFILEKPEK